MSWWGYVLGWCAAQRKLARDAANKRHEDMMTRAMGVCPTCRRDLNHGLCPKCEPEEG